VYVIQRDEMVLCSEQYPIDAEILPKSVTKDFALMGLT